MGTKVPFPTTSTSTTTSTSSTSTSTTTISMFTQFFKILLDNFPNLLVYNLCRRNHLHGAATLQLFYTSRQHSLRPRPIHDKYFPGNTHVLDLTVTVIQFLSSELSAFVNFECFLFATLSGP